MTEAAWQADIAKFVIGLRAPPAGSEPKQNRLEFALATLWHTMQAPPPTVQDAYEDLEEPHIQRPATARAAELGKATWVDWEPDLTSDLKSIVLAVAIEIRALDQALAEVRGTPQRSGDPNREYLAFGDEKVFIIPRPQGFVPTGCRCQTFDRRGLVRHRILPILADGYVVRLYEPLLRGPGMAGEEAELVSAVFSRVKPDIVKDGGGGFWVQGLLNENEVEVSLEAQLDLVGGAGPAMAVVWPELSLTPRLRDRVSDFFSEQGLADNPAEIGFIVAGSWHEERGEHRYNVARVLDADGESRFEVFKRKRFRLNGDLEAITPGREIAVLIYGEVLIGFGICKDFCERRLPSPYRHLDVDFIFAPSLSRAKTIHDHSVVAESLSFGFGTRSFVVQQNLEPKIAEPWGVTLRPNLAPRAGSATSEQKKFVARSSVACTIP